MSKWYIETKITKSCASTILDPVLALKCFHSKSYWSGQLPHPKDGGEQQQFRTVILSVCQFAAHTECHAVLRNGHVTRHERRARQPHPSHMLRDKIDCTVGFESFFLQAPFGLPWQHGARRQSWFISGTWKISFQTSMYSSFCLLVARFVDTVWIWDT